MSTSENGEHAVANGAKLRGMTTIYSVMPSPVGELTLRWEDDALVGLYFEGYSALEKIGEWTRDDGVLAPVRAQLEEYFAGARRAFDVPLRLHGTTFQKAVWQALLEIPYGELESYGAIAAKCGSPTWPGPRAAGQAAGSNPVAIIVPCHRVVGSSGALVGFGGGLPRKRTLLAVEGIHEERTPHDPQMRLGF